MSHADFVHLRVHSAYSLAEGAIRIKQLVELCQANDMPAVALTDTGNMFGALEFATAAAAGGLQPIVGCQLGIRRQRSEGALTARSGLQEDPDQLVLLVQSETGYRNLLHLVSRAFLENEPGEHAQVALADLEGRTDGLIALTGGVAGPVGRLLAEGQGDAAVGMLDRLKRLFPDRLYVELQRHGLEAEDLIEPALVDLAYVHELPLLATNEPYFATADMHAAHDALLCISTSSYVSQSDRRRATVEHRFKSAAEMRELFADLPEAVDNTLVVARRCAFMPVTAKPMLPPFATESGRDEASELREQAAAGLEERLVRHVFTEEMDEARRAEVAKEYRDRLDFELNTIEAMGYPGYFLIVADFIKWSKNHNIPVGPGRGSGAGSVVAWSLTITDLDPLRWGLFFERFLNPERVSMPDFDIDFCQERRDEVIHYVQQKYGDDRVAQIITFGKLQARAVIKDVGRVLEMPYGQVDRISKLVPNNPANPVSLKQAIDGEPQLQQLRDEDEAVAYLLDLALRLEGLYRNSSTHAAGVVIGDRPLEEIIPLYRDPRSDMRVTQFNMKYAEAAGLVKFDFLGLKTLDVLQRAVELLAERAIPVDLQTLPLDDARTFAMLSRGDTTGVFQCESSGVRDVLRKLKPDRFEDIIAVVALYRPGPMDNIPSYIRRKHGEEDVDYLHPTLERSLKETYGIPIYQEQVMQMAQELSGYSLGGADLLRRAMGKKIQAEMDAQRDLFVAGAAERGVDKTTSSRIFETIAKFAGYGFNKAHAAAYALIAYQTAWLKANYPVEFLAASMTLDMGNTDKLGVYRQELARQGIELLPPDINRSNADFAVERLADGETGEAVYGVRYALAAVKGVGRQAMAALVADREANGPFRDLFDLAGRIDPHLINKKQLEHLSAAGAFDSLNGNRAQIFAAIDLVLGHASASQRERASGQFNLLGDVDDAATAPRLPNVADWPQAERLQRELDSIGFYLSAHPLDEYQSMLGRLGIVRAADLAATVRACGGAALVKLAGAVLGVQQRTSQRGSRYAFVQLSDPSGAFEITVFSEVLATARDLVEGDQPVLVTAAARLEDDQIRLTTQAITALEAAVASAPARLKVWLDDVATLPSLRRLIDEQARAKGVARARGQISLIIPADDKEVEIALQGGYVCTPQIRAAIRAIPGIVDVREV
jgi:DNA polymerase-3 subunit alpha